MNRLVIFSDSQCYIVTLGKFVCFIALRIRQKVFFCFMPAACTFIEGKFTGLFFP